MNSDPLDATIRTLEIDFPGGRKVNPAKGTSITKQVTIAGHGARKPIKDKGLARRHPGATNFSKMRGEAVVEDEGVLKRVEVHWYESAKTGIVEMKFKRFLK